MGRTRTAIKDMSVLTITNLLSDRTNTLFYWCYFILNQWIHFIELELYKMTLEDEAHIFGKSKTTYLYAS